ncbi:MAG: Mpo1-like protein [Gammaproteobacteria bacterium]|nr:DUF962 domain-containing protein [Gammaproteobacteria bacterium]
MGGGYGTFRDFYPFYLGEHQSRSCRRMHFIGTSLVLLTLLGVFESGDGWGLLLIPLFGYGFAWAGHFFFEKNRPATFTHPLYSFMGDWVMYRDMLTGRISF